MGLRSLLRLPLGEDPRHLVEPDKVVQNTAAIGRDPHFSSSVEDLIQRTLPFTATSE